MRYKGRMSNAKVRANWPHAVVVEAAALQGLGVHLNGANPTYADAILDRLVHNAHRIDLTGDSMRRKEPRNA